MASGISGYERFQDGLQTAYRKAPRNSLFVRHTSKINGKQISDLSTKRTEKYARGNYFYGRELSRVFSEDYDLVENTALDPRGPVVSRWNKIFLLACFISLFVDPLFFYLPVIKEDEACLDISEPLEVALTVIRSMVDAFYIVQIFVRFRTAYVAPSSRVFGRGELVIDRSKIASRYLHKDFWLDLIAAIPLPQVLIWVAIPRIKNNVSLSSAVLLFLIIFQYLLRLYLVVPLSRQIVKFNGILMETAWAGAAYNLMLYMLASHLVGSWWYRFSVHRLEECWKQVCILQKPNCQNLFFSCRRVNEPGRVAWLKTSNISGLCSAESDFFQFGIYGDAVSFRIAALNFLNKYYYCLWWGLRNLSSLGQNLSTSTYVGEINFALVIAILGSVLFALLIGNVQMYLQSTTVRLEEWRIRRTDTEKWMHHRQLPHDLRQSVRKYDQYKWVATRGVDEEDILKGLPMDLRRVIKRHLCLDLVRKVPLFDQMDDRMLDAICERLKPSLCTPGTCLVHEGDPVNEMLFIVRGHLDSYTTDGGRTGFFNSSCIGPGDFCGEELLTWAMDPRPIVLPSSTRTVEALIEVEAFALTAEDLKFVAAQFRRLVSKQLRHTFRFYSHQWRTWAACFIQAAWFRYKRRKEAAELKMRESRMVCPPESALKANASVALNSSSDFIVYAAKLAASTRRGGSKRGTTEFDILSSSLQKPAEPNFSAEDG